MSTRAAQQAAAAAGGAPAPHAGDGGAPGDAQLAAGTKGLPRFSGGPGFHAWSWAVENLTFGIEGPERTRRILSCFDGEALQAIMLMVPPAAFAANWEQVRPLVVATFSTVEPAWVRDARFASKLRHAPGMSMRGYVQLFAAEVSATSGLISEADRLRYFLGGLAMHPMLVTMIARGNPATTSDLLAAAYLFESFLTSGAAASPTIPSAQQGVDALSSEDLGPRGRGNRRNEPWRGRGGGRRPRDNPTMQRRNLQDPGHTRDGDRQRGRCWQCGSATHYRAQCPVKTDVYHTVDPL